MQKSPAMLGFASDWPTVTFFIFFFSFDLAFAVYFGGTLVLKYTFLKFLTLLQRFRIQLNYIF